jgi:hypothetical protein
LKILKKVTNNGCVTITDEAFTIMALGNQQFMGWSDQVYNHYDDVCKLIKKQRGNTASTGLEKEFQHMREYANGRVVSHMDTSREQQHKVFDELDID